MAEPDRIFVGETDYVRWSVAVENTMRLNAEIKRLEAERTWRNLSDDDVPMARDVLVWQRGNRGDQYNERAIVARVDLVTTKVSGALRWCIPGIGGLKASHWMPAPHSPSDAGEARQLSEAELIEQHAKRQSGDA